MPVALAAEDTVQRTRVTAGRPSPIAAWQRWPRALWLGFVPVALTEGGPLKPYTWQQASDAGSARVRTVGDTPEGFWAATYVQAAEPVATIDNL